MSRVIECWGPMRGLDLTASRRLMLAAEASGVAVLVLPSVAREYSKGDFSIQAYIPIPEMPPGRYTYIATFNYKVNPLRDATLNATHVDFEIQ